MQFAGLKLANKDGWFGKSDPFVTIDRSREDGSWMRVWSSPVIMDNLNPTWAPSHIPMQALCNGDSARPILVKVFDWDSDGTHDFMGQCESSVDDLLAVAGGAGKPLCDKNGKVKKRARNSNRRLRQRR